MTRRYGEPAPRGVEARRRHGVYAILERDGRLLLTVQTIGARPDFQLPGGGVEAGESPVAALHREVREETGWRISRPRRLGRYRLFAQPPDDDTWYEKHCEIWLARPVLCPGPAVEPGHHPVWATLPAALDLIRNPGDLAFLRQFLADQGSRRPSTRIP